MPDLENQDRFSIHQFLKNIPIKQTAEIIRAGVNNYTTMEEGGVAVGRQANWPTGNWPTKLVDKDNWPTVNWSTKLADKNIF